MEGEIFKNTKFNLDRLNSLSSMSAKGIYLLESLRSANNKDEVVFIFEKSRTLDLNPEDKDQIESLARLMVKELSVKNEEMNLADKIYALNAIHKTEDFSKTDFVREFKDIIDNEPLDTFENFDRLIYVLDSWIDKIPEEENINIFRKLAFNLIALFDREIEKAENLITLDRITAMLIRHASLLEIHTGKNNVVRIKEELIKKIKKYG